MTGRDPTLRGLPEFPQLTALVGGLVTECAIALLLWSLHWEAVLAGVASLTRGVAVYAACAHFLGDQR